MFDLEVFLYWFCYFNVICTKAIEMAAAELPMVYRYYEKSRTSAADGISFRGCLSDGDDIFSKSVENQGGANRTFATGGRSWRVWQHYITSHAKIEWTSLACAQAPIEVFHSIFAWLVTHNLHIFNLPVDGLHAVFFQEVVSLAERSAAEETAVGRQGAGMRGL